MFFIATKPKPAEGASLRAALIRVMTRAKRSPHLAFATRELAETYLDAKGVSEQLSVIAEDGLSVGVDYHFRWGVILIRSQEALDSFINTPEDFVYEDAMADYVDLVAITSVIVATPLGPMTVAGSVRSNIAMAIDLFFAAVMARAIADFSVKMMPATLGVTAETVTVIVLFMVFAVYILRRKLFRFRTPTEWALGLRVFSFSQLPGYSGAGFLCCREILPPSEDSRRTILIALSIAVLVAGSLFAP
jgi:hypothetical protein